MKALIVNSTEYEFSDDGTADTLLASGAIERSNSDGSDYTPESEAEAEGDEESEDGTDQVAEDEDGDVYYRLVHGRTFAVKEVEALIEAF